MKAIRESLIALSSTNLILLLLIGPVASAPSLGLGSTTNYQLAASVRASQACQATPQNMTTLACGGLITNPNPIQSTAQVSIFDSGTGQNGCTNVPQFPCGFNPATLNIAQGTQVIWTNNGLQPHTVTSCSLDHALSNTTFACTNGLNDPNLPGFDSGILYSNRSYPVKFNYPGTYYYFCQVHSWLHGQVTVFAQRTQVIGQSPTSLQLNFTGNLGWNIVGLDASVAVLNVTHQLDHLTVDGIPITFTESGSFQQSVDLSTRFESPGTAAGILSELLSHYLGAISSLGSVGGISSMAPFSQAYDKRLYTAWWVNGPLAEGSPVQILTGYSSVEGSQMLDLGSLGSRDSWIVLSEFSQSFTAGTLRVPFDPFAFMPAPTTTLNAKLSLQFYYDKANDLLLKTQDTATAVVVMQTLYQAGQQICSPTYPTSCMTLSYPLAVIRNMTVALSLSLQLVSTNLPLSTRTIPPSQGTPGGNSQPAAPTILFYGVAGTAAVAIAGAGLWIALKSPLRKRIRFLELQPYRKPS